MRAALALVVLAGCSSVREGNPTTFEDLSLWVPYGWQAREVPSPVARHAMEWTPSDNEAKESLTLLRTEPRAAFAQHGATAIAPYLAQAQAQLPRASFAAPQPFASQHGLRGVRIEGQFVPPGQTVPYRRLHAIVPVDDHLLHVIYTAREPDREAFDLVLDTLQKRGG